METVERKHGTARTTERPPEPMTEPDTRGASPGSAGAGSDRLAQAMGILFFLLGIGVIAFVLYQAFQLYQNPTLGVSGGKVVNPSAAQIGKDLIAIVLRGEREEN